MQDAAWSWQSGTPFEYAKWIGGRPLNATLGAGGAACLSLFVDSDKKPWLDTNCFNNLYPICMKLKNARLNSHQ